MRRRLATSLTLALSTTAGVVQATPSGPLYIDDASGQIGTVNLATGAVTVLGSSGVVLTDIAFTAGGTLYGTDFGSLYSINTTNGAATLVSNYGTFGQVNALVGSGNGLYAAASGSTSLYAVGVSPYSAITLTGNTGGRSAATSPPRQLPECSTRPWTTEVSLG